MLCGRRFPGEWGDRGAGDSVCNPGSMYASNASYLVLNFSAAGLQDFVDESRGQDNVQVAIAPVPVLAAVAVRFGVVGLDRHGAP